MKKILKILYVFLAFLVFLPLIARAQPVLYQESSEAYKVKATSITSSQSISGKGAYWVTGGSIIVQYTSSIGNKMYIGGDTAGVSVWMIQEGSLDEVGGNSGATVYSSSAPWLYEIWHISGTSSVVTVKLGNKALIPATD